MSRSFPERGPAPSLHLPAAPAHELPPTASQALLTAAVSGDGGLAHQRVVRSLLAAGADPSSRDSHGSSARDLAVDLGLRDIVRLLDQAHD